MLTLVRLARQHQLTVYDRDDPALASIASLISSDAVTGGFNSLSELRLEDTVYAEFNFLRAVIHALYGKPARFTSGELAGYIQAPQNSKRFYRALEALEYVGMISINSRGIITVTRLYRPALNINLGRNSNLNLEEEKDLQDRVDTAFEDWPDDANEVELRDLSSQERKLIHEYVHKNYPDFMTSSMSTGKLSELKTVRIRRQNPNPSRRKERHRTRDRKNPSTDYASVQDLELEGYDPADIGLLLGLRAEAAQVEGHFVGSPIKRPLGSNLVAIDRSMRKNEERRRIIAMIARTPHPDDLESGDVQLILGKCHTLIIDPRPKLWDITPELREEVSAMVNRLCNIAATEKRPVIITFSCSDIKNLALTLADQYPNISFTRCRRISPLTVVLQLATPEENGNTHTNKKETQAREQ
jgi:hypothetical protein